MKAIILYWVLLISFSNVNGQFPVGSWRDHLPYHNGIKVVKIGTKLYCATPLAMFTFDTKDNSLEKVNKLAGLSDIGIATIDYEKNKDILVIAYTNGNIDLIKGKQIINIPDVKRKIMTGAKSANHIYFRDNYAYISYAFGILVVDLDKFEIKDTYYISENGTSIPVNSLTADENYFYAATNKGIFKADINDPFLVNYTHWQRETLIPQPLGRYNHIVNFNNQVIVNLAGGTQNSDTIYLFNNGIYSKISSLSYGVVKELRAIDTMLFVTCDTNMYILDRNFQVALDFKGSNPDIDLVPYSSYRDEEGTIWIADYYIGLVKKAESANSTFMYPNGPASKNVRNLNYVNDMLLVTGGGVNVSWAPIARPGELSVFKNENWESDINYNYSDYMVATVDPVEKSKIYVGAWGYGLLVYNGIEYIERFNEFNSSLQTIVPGTINVRIGGLTFDQNNNLWVVNSQVPSPISVRKPDGTWKSFEYFRFMDIEYTIGSIHYDKFGQFWVVLPLSNGLWVFTVNGTIDDETDDNHSKTKFFPKNVFGETINNVICVTSDRDGNVWVGTNRGPIVYSNPPDVLANPPLTDGYQPTIARKDTSGLADALLGTETINCIAVDGANRKWFGTDKGGVYLFSPDGTQEILHFTTENSPLISDNIVSIAINDKTGEVYFGTEMGIVSYRAVATEPLNNFDGAYVFPNPVRPDYSGEIVISKLVENTIVKITDISGNLVYQVKSLGGQAVWDGKNRKGNKVASGVYLIFLTNEDGSETKVLKLLVVK